MSLIDISAIKQWDRVNSYYLPLGADYTCPLCNMLSHHNRRSTGSYDNLNGLTMAIQMSCTRCGGSSLMWVIGVNGGARTAEALLVYPNIKKVEAGRSFSDFENGVVPERVLKIYQAAVLSFEAGIWDGAGTLCGKALEGAVTSKLPEGKRGIKGLWKQLEALREDASLTDPFNELADAIRVGRNVSAHFDVTIEINEATAKSLLDLVEYVLEFLFVYEARAKALADQIEALKAVVAEVGDEDETMHEEGS